MRDEAFGGQFATDPEPRMFNHPPCAGDWSMGDICLDHEELGWSASCSFESFDIQMGQEPYTFSHASSPLSDANREMYYDASVSWEEKER